MWNGWAPCTYPNQDRTVLTSLVPLAPSWPINAAVLISAGRGQPMKTLVHLFNSSSEHTAVKSELLCNTLLSNCQWRLCEKQMLLSEIEKVSLPLVSYCRLSTFFNHWSTACKKKKVWIIKIVIPCIVLLQTREGLIRHEFLHEFIFFSDNRWYKLTYINYSRFILIYFNS